MHELSIAYNLVDIASQAAEQAHAQRVDVVYLRLGRLSGVEKDALLFGYDIAVKETILEGSRLEIEDVPVTVYCSVCDAVFELEDIQLFCCPQCGTPTGDIRQGRELEIISLEIDNEQSAYS